MIENFDQNSETELFVVDATEADVRIDKILGSRYSEVRSRTYFQYLIAEEEVLVNGKAVKKQFRPKEGDEVEVHFVLTPELEIHPEDIPLDILYEDEYLLAIHKPAGMVVHPAPGNWSGTFVNALLYHCRLSESDFFQSQNRPGIVHRLDKDTSGVLLAAKDALTQQRLAEQFASRVTYKEYLAICCGNPGTGELNAPIGRHPVHRKLMKVVEKGEGRDSLTKYRTVATDGKISVVRIHLVTGRTHQIRVHMKHLQTPVLGDPAYGNSQLNRRYGETRQLLHARCLKIIHPHTKELLTFEAPIPADIEKYLHYFHLENDWKEEK